MNANDNIFEGILLEDPIVEDTAPEAPYEFNPVTALLAVFGPPVATVGAWAMMGEVALLVWLVSVVVGLIGFVRKLSPTQAICAAGVYVVIMLFEFLCIVVSIPGLVVFSDSF